MWGIAGGPLSAPVRERTSALIQGSFCESGFTVIARPEAEAIQNPQR